MAALIAYFFTMLICVCVDSPAVWQNSWRGLDSLVVPQQRTFYQKNTGAVLLNVMYGYGGTMFFPIIFCRSSVVASMYGYGVTM